MELDLQLGARKPRLLISSLAVNDETEFGLLHDWQRPTAEGQPWASEILKPTLHRVSVVVSVAQALQGLTS
jgi:hypothetical protein